MEISLPTAMTGLSHFSGTARSSLRPLATTRCPFDLPHVGDFVQPVCGIHLCYHGNCGGDLFFEPNVFLDIGLPQSSSMPCSVQVEDEFFAVVSWQSSRRLRTSFPALCVAKFAGRGVLKLTASTS